MGRKIKPPPQSLTEDQILGALRAVVRLALFYKQVRCDGGDNTQLAKFFEDLSALVNGHIQRTRAGFDDMTMGFDARLLEPQLKNLYKSKAFREMPQSKRIKKLKELFANSKAKLLGNYSDGSIALLDVHPAERSERASLSRVKLKEFFAVNQKTLDKKMKNRKPCTVFLGGLSNPIETDQFASVCGSIFCVPSNDLVKIVELLDQQFPNKFYDKALEFGVPT